MKHVCISNISEDEVQMLSVARLLLLKAPKLVISPLFTHLVSQPGRFFLLATEIESGRPMFQFAFFPFLPVVVTL